MENSKSFHSVYLNKEKCLGCTTCLRSCPTGAIRIRGGKAKIIQSKCIDCGECIRVCPHRAKMAITDSLQDIRQYHYKVAMIAPTLIGQFPFKYSTGRILSAIKELGFDEAVEVATGAEIVGSALSKEFQDQEKPRPIISSACPAVSKLIQVRFPELTKNISTLKSPMAVTARMVRKRLVEEQNMQNDDIGIFFITPCAAKATEINDIREGEDPFDRIDGAISIKDVYGPLRALLKKTPEEDDIAKATWEGYRWALSGGESHYAGDKRFIRVHGIAAVAAVLEEIENDNLDDIEFFEGLACSGGCIGGCLTVENNFVARMVIEERAEEERKRKRTLYASGPTIHELTEDQEAHIRRDKPLEPRQFKPLDPDFETALAKMNTIEILEKRLPGLDCGACGAPGCRALAEDIVTGYAREIDCVFVMKDRVMELSKLTNELLQMEHPMGSELTNKEEKTNEN